MTRSPFVWGLVLSGVFSVSMLVSCKPDVTPTTLPKQEHIYDVGWPVLIRDYATAYSYTNLRVRIRFDKGDYKIEGNELRVYAAENGAPPIIVVRFTQPVFGGPLSSIIVTGLCQGPTRDGIWRNRNADYCVTLTDSMITAR